MEAVAKCCQQCILESGRKPTNRDLKGVFCGRYDKYLQKYGTLQQKLVVWMVDFISQMSGLTSALYRHAVSHTNCTRDRFQQWDSTASVVSTAPAS